MLGNSHCLVSGWDGDQCQRESAGWDCSLCLNGLKFPDVPFHRGTVFAYIIFSREYVRPRCVNAVEADVHKTKATQSIGLCGLGILPLQISLFKNRCSHSGSFIASDWLRCIGRNENHTRAAISTSHKWVRSLARTFREGRNDKPSCLHGVAVAHPLF